MNQLIRTTLLVFLFLASRASAFSYQGELSQAGAPFDGVADIEFTLFDAESGGLMAGTADLHSNIAVAQGRFVVELEQWSIEIDGRPLWLELAVSAPAGGGLTILSPRQELSPAPYATYALDGAGGGAAGDITGVTAGAGLLGGGVTGDVALDIDLAAFWLSTGNTGTDSNSNFLGTNDNQAIEFKANGSRVMRYEPESASNGPNILGGSTANSIVNGASGAVIAGGGTFSQTNCGALANEDCGNVISQDFGSIGGGMGNRVFGRYATVAGGVQNRAEANHSTIGGGLLNEAIGRFSTVSGGLSNEANEHSSTVSGGAGNAAEVIAATVSGGDSNRAAGLWSTIPGGRDNVAGGDFSFAAGQRAIVRDSIASGIPSGDLGTFVWADSTDLDFTSSGPDQFLVRATGGMAVGSNDPAGYQLRVDGQTFVATTNDADADLILGNVTGGDDGILGSETGKVSSDLIFRSNDAFDFRLDVDNSGEDADFVVRDANQTALFNIDESGDVSVTGNISKGGGSFKIDHPLDPENKYLYHSFVESPDMMNIYNGNITTNHLGEAWVELPEWFESLNREFRYQLTVMGVFAQAIVAQRVTDNGFLIRTNQPEITVSWQVTGIRKDPYAEKNRIPIEEDKPAAERGKYLHPQARDVEDRSKWMVEAIDE